MVNANTLITCKANGGNCRGAIPLGNALYKQSMGFPFQCRYCMEANGKKKPTPNFQLPPIGVQERIRIIEEGSNKGRGNGGNGNARSQSARGRGRTPPPSGDAWELRKANARAAEFEKELKLLRGTVGPETDQKEVKERREPIVERAPCRDKE